MQDLAQIQKQFYVYIKCKPCGRPFYVGKGLDGRAFSLKGRTNHFKNIVNKYGVNSIKTTIINVENEEQAFLKK